MLNGIAVSMYHNRPTALFSTKDWLYLLTEAGDGKYMLRTAYNNRTQKKLEKLTTDSDLVADAEYRRMKYEEMDDIYEVSTDTALAKEYRGIPIYMMVTGIQCLKMYYRNMNKTYDVRRDRRTMPTKRIG